MTEKKEGHSGGNLNGQESETNSKQHSTIRGNGGQGKSLTPDEYLVTVIHDGSRNSELHKQILFARERDWPDEGIDRLAEKAIRLDGLTPAEVAKTRRSAMAAKVVVTTPHTTTTTKKRNARPPANAAHDLIEYLACCFEPEDRVLPVVGFTAKPDGKHDPLIRDHTTITVMDLVGRIQKDGIPGALHADATAGAWIVVNPVEGGARQEHVTSYRNCLIEGDEQPVAEQIRILRESGLPIRAMVHSGGKSIHAVVAVDAKDFEEYKERREELWNLAREFGLKVDESNKNPNRMTRIPSVQRGNGWQYLIEVDEHASYSSWKSRNDPWQPMDLAQVFTEDPPERDWLFADTIGAGDLCGLAAEGGSGKTYLALILAMSLSSGRCLLPAFKPLGPRRVMLMAGEDPKQIVWSRLKAIALEYSLSPTDLDRIQANMMIVAGQSEPLTGYSNQGPCRTARWEWLKNQIAKHDPALLILDPKSRWDGGLSENDAASATAFITAIQDLIGDTRAGLILHHVAKAYGQDVSSSSARGSTALRDGCRWFANMTRLSDGELKSFDLEPEDPFVRLTVTKANYSPGTPGPIYLKRVDGGVLKQEDLRAGRLERIARRIREWLTDYGSAYLRDLRRCRGDDYKNLQEFFDHKPKRKDFVGALDFAVASGMIMIKDDEGRQVVVV